MSVLDEFVRMLAEFKNAKDKKTSSYDTTAVVRRVEGNTVWVHIPGGVDETPVKRTIDAKAGDSVLVRVGGGKAWITGNATNPPTDDTEANRAQTMARSAAQRAQLAVEVADEAGVAAEEAVHQSDEAIQQASASLMTDTLYYLATSASSGVTINTPGWTDTPQSIDSSKRYLWTYHTYTKVSGATSNTQPVISGVYGQTGATITSVTELYALNDDSYSPPADNAFSANWSPPTASNRYLWNMEQITYSDSTTSYTTKHILLTYTPGIQGRGIASITEYYALSTAAVEPPTSDFSTTVPTMTSTSKYMWNYEVIAYTDGLNPTTTDKRIIGVYGDTGLTGKSLTGITEYYALSNSSTTEPADNDFSTTVQNPTASSKYVWNYELMTWNDNGITSTTRTDKRVVAVYGDKGNTGKALTGITEYYARNNSTSAPADNAFSTSVTQPTASYKYVWNFERLTWNDNGTTSTTDTAKHIVAVYGDKGDQGVSITSVQPQYYLSTSASEPTGGSWGTTLNWTTGKYIWTRDLITYSNNSTSTSTPVYNSALTSACINAANAYAIAQDTNQYFWHTESGTDTGTHITEVSQSDFESDPQNAGGNLLARSNGVAIRKGLTELATLTGNGLNVSNDSGASLASFGIDSNSKPYASFGGEKAIIKYSEDEVFGLNSHRIVMANNDPAASNYRHDATMSSRQVFGADWKTSPVGFVNANHKNYGNYKYSQALMFASDGVDKGLLDFPSIALLQEGTNYPEDDILGYLFGDGFHIFASKFTVNLEDWTSLYRDFHNFVGTDFPELQAVVEDDTEAISQLSSTLGTLGTMVTPSNSNTSIPKNNTWTTGGPTLTLTTGAWIITAVASIPSSGSVGVRKGLRIYKTSPTPASVVSGSTILIPSSISGEQNLQTTGLVSVESDTAKFRCQGYLGSAAETALTYTFSIQAMKVGYAE